MNDDNENIKILKHLIEDKPFFFDFQKYQFVNPCPGMVDLNYDPYPDKQMEDVVRSEILATKRWLYADVEGEGTLWLRPGKPIKVDGQIFYIEEAEIQIHASHDQSKANITASFFLGECEPLKTLAKLREMMSASNRQN